MPDPIVITAHRVNGGKLKIYCPLCGQTHEIPDTACGRFYMCPNQGGKLKLNPFVIEPKITARSRKSSASKHDPKTISSKENSESLKNPAAKHDFKTTELDKYGIITPPGILTRLDRSIIGQRKAKMQIAAAIYYHKLSLHFFQNQQQHKPHPTGPILLAGPTGTGKTFIIQRACQVAELPFIHVDTSSMVEEGIVGFSINDLGKEVLSASKGCRDSAAHAVVFFDESDKLLKTHFGSSVTSQLLRILEGTELRLCGSRDDQAPLPVKSLPTDRMLFLLGGAFQWLIQEQAKKPIGFAGDASLPPLAKNFLSASGLPKEFAGRIRNVLWLEDLTERDLYEILVRSDASPLHDYINTIKGYVAEVHVDDDALREIAKISNGLGYGARSLHRVLHMVFNGILFKAPTLCEDNQVRITREDVRKAVEIIV